MSKSYVVLDSIRHNGKTYSPKGKNSIELTEEDAAPLLRVGVISEGEVKPTVPEGAERAAAIKAAIEGLDKSNAELFTKDGVTPKTDAIAAVTGWPVTAAERDEVLKASAE